MDIVFLDIYDIKLKILRVSYTEHTYSSNATNQQQNSADIISSHEVSFESSYLPGSSFNF